MKRFRKTLILCAVIILAGLAAVAYAVTTVATVDSDEAGTTITRTTMTIGTVYDFTNDGRTLLLVENAEATTGTLTIVTGGTLGGYAVDDLSVTMPPTSEKVLGVFNTGTFNQTSGRVQLSCATTTCSFAPVRVR